MSVAGRAARAATILSRLGARPPVAPRAALEQRRRHVRPRGRQELREAGVLLGVPRAEEVEGRPGGRGAEVGAVGRWGGAAVARREVEAAAAEAEEAEQGVGCARPERLVGSAAGVQIEPAPISGRGQKGATPIHPRSAPSRPTRQTGSTSHPSGIDRRSIPTPDKSQSDSGSIPDRPHTKV